MKKNDYERLIQVIDQMIKDKVQLLHAGSIIDWNDTKIIEIIKSIKRNKESFSNIEIEAGTKLTNLVSGQEAFVINDKNGKISLIVHSDIIVYPKDEIGSHFTIAQPPKK